MNMVDVLLRHKLVLEIVEMVDNYRIKKQINRKQIYGIKLQDLFMFPVHEWSFKKLIMNTVHDNDEILKTI